MQKEQITIPGATKARQGPGRLRKDNENVSMRYVIDVHGNVVDGDRAEAIRDCMRAWLRGRTDLPSTWKHHAAEELKKTLYEHMYQRFAELQLCDFDWKVEKIAIDIFPQVMAANRKHAHAAKANKKKKSKKSKKRVHGMSPSSASAGGNLCTNSLQNLMAKPLHQEKRPLPTSANMHNHS